MKVFKMEKKSWDFEMKTKIVQNESKECVKHQN